MDPRLHRVDGRDRTMAWAGLLLPPAAFLINLNTNYMLVSPTCLGRTGPAIHLVMLGSLLMAGIGGLLAHRTWKNAGAGWPGEEGGWAGDGPFLGLMGMMFSVLVTLVIIAQWIAALVLHPCQ